MTRRRLTVVAALTVLAAIAVAAWMARVPIALVLVERMAERRLGTDAIAALPDGLHVGLCGTGSPFPDELRGGPCTFVVAGRRLLVFDAGSGAARSISRMGFDTGRIDAILLTHLHSDHLDGLGELMLQRWVGGTRTEPVPVYGPRGVDAVIDGFALAYGADRGWRVDHHGAAIVPPTGAGGLARPLDTGAAGRVVLIDEPDLQVVAFEVDHAPVHPALGYRIRYKDRTVVLSGDTRESDAVRREARQVDLLVHEALSPTLLARLESAAAKVGRSALRQILVDIVDYHTTPEQAAAVARDAGFGLLVLNHIVPPLPLAVLEEAFVADARRIWSGPIRVGRDGDLISLPAGTRDTRLGHRP
jgi:ribonuclease Z